MTARSRIAVIGGWHLGAVAAGAWPGMGFAVVLWDPDPEIRARISDARPPVAEPGLAAALETALREETLSVTESCAAAVASAPVTHLAFDSKLDELGHLDDDRLDAAIETFAQSAPDEALLLVSSQVPAGTCRAFAEKLRRVDRGLAVAYLPENLRLGEALERFKAADGTVLGVDEPSAEARAMAVVRALDGAPIVMDTVSAELVKHARNAYLALCIVFANELAWVSRSLGARVEAVTGGLRADPRVSPGAPLRPGGTFSGATLERDLRVLSGAAHAAGRPELFETLLALNRRHETTPVTWLTEELGESLEGRAIAVVGLAYKPGTSTLRDSSAIRVVRELLDRGATCRAHDPLAESVDLGPRFERADSLASCIEGADAVLVLSGLDEARDAKWSDFAPRRRLLIDATGVVDAGNAIDAGWTVRSLTA